MISILGFVVCRGKVTKYQPFNIFSTGGEIEIRRSDGSCILGKILPSTMSKKDIETEQILFHAFVEWGA